MRRGSRAPYQITRARLKWHLDTLSHPTSAPRAGRPRPHSKPALLTKHFERSAQLLAEDLRLLPSREVPAFVEPVVVDEVLGIRPLGPGSRCLVELVWEHADGIRNGNVLGVEEVRLVLPVEAGRGDTGVRQPVKSDVVEDVVSRQGAQRLSLQY